MDDEAIKELARLYSMSIVEIADLARAFALAEIDPLKEPKGEAFVFQRQRQRPGPFGSREEDFDFNWINQEVPEPDAKVDLLIALYEFRRDSDRCANLLAENAEALSIERLVAISNNRLMWARFLAVRHPNPTLRALAAKNVSALETLRAQNSAHADELLRRQGVTRLSRER